MRVERCGESISIFMNFAWLHHICCNFHSSPSPSYRWQNIKRTFWQWLCVLTVYSGPQIVKLWKYGSKMVQECVKISGFHRLNTIYAFMYFCRRLENDANYAYFCTFWSPQLWSHNFFRQSSCLLLSVASSSIGHPLAAKEKLNIFPGKLDVQLNF